MKRCLCLLGTLTALLCLCAAAAAESACVITPGGALNMRKSASSKAGIVIAVPNKALVEVEEVGEEWSRIVYNKKTGYVKTEFLRLPAQLVGKTVYADNGDLLLRASASADAPIVWPVSAAEGVLVEQVTDGWALVRAGEHSGYVAAAELSYQWETPTAEPAWIREAGVLATDCTLLASPEAGATVIAELTAGKAETVTAIKQEYCLIVTDGGCGYVPIAAVCLAGAEDGETVSTALSPVSAAAAAETALKKKYKAFSKEKLYFTVAMHDEKDGFAGPLYHCAFYNENDQYLYGALVEIAGDKVLFTASYAGFAVPQRSAALLPYGEVQVALSAQTLAIGEVLDIAVSAWTEHQCQYILTCAGEAVAESLAGSHFTAAYRALEAGEYLLSVTVTDEEGYAVTAEQTFTVDDALPQPDPFSTVYSQKDGWWLDKKYRKSTLDHSGCAIFSLSCALQRMGFTGEDVLPENLARTYALCLTEEGTNNERLVREAGEDYGYTYKSTLSRDQKWIVSKLQSGAMFSFSVARGHIALIDGISEDGAMAHIVDSAPTATFTRIVGESLYYQLRSGSFRAALTLEEIPGARWYFATDHCGGLEYWLRIEYVAKRGVRLIEPAQ